MVPCFVHLLRENGSYLNEQYLYKYCRDLFDQCLQVFRVAKIDGKV